MHEYEVKYDIELDLMSENSLKLINDRLADNKEILEIGPANGRLTRHLKEKRNCAVDIVEYNPISGADASKYARTALIGEKEGNVENDIWIEKLKKNKYDYIIFADVLEHLYYPKKVLEKCKSLLKNDGKILVSIPNIANVNIILSLIKGEFNYTPTGLLDDTHIRFFTKKTFKRMIESIGYFCTYIDCTLVKMYESEVNIKPDDFRDCRFEDVKHTKYGDAYQWIFELSLNSENLNCVEKYKKRFTSESTTIYQAVGLPFINGEYISENVMFPEQSYDGNTYIAKFDIKNCKTEGRFRFDPEEGSACILEIISIDTDLKKYHIESVNAMICEGNTYMFSTDDPIIEIVGDYSEATYIKIEYKIKELSYSILSKYIEEINNNINEIKKENTQIKEENTQIKEENIRLKNDIIAIKSTRGYRLLEKIRSFVRKK